MYHWCLLAKASLAVNSKGSAEAPERSSARMGFVPWGGPHWPEPAPEHIRKRFALLGAIESLPICGAMGIGLYFEPAVSLGGVTFGGFVLSVLLCWFLRHHTPPTVIHAVPSVVVAKDVPNAPREGAT